MWRGCGEQRGGCQDRRTGKEIKKQVASCRAMCGLGISLSCEDNGIPAAGSEQRSSIIPPGFLESPRLLCAEQTEGGSVEQGDRKGVQRPT